MLKHKIPAVLATLVGVVVLGTGFYVLMANEGDKGPFTSVEVGISELSQAEGAEGAAVPASGNSVCSLALSPSSITQGQTTALSWSWNHPEAWQLTHMYVNRNGGSIGVLPNGGTDSGAAALAPGSYTYTIYNNIPDGDHDWDGMGGTVYVECSATLTVNAVPVPDPVKPNLVSEALAKVGGGTTVAAGASVSFTARVRNLATSTDAGAGPFRDVFRWYDEQAAQWKIINYVDHTAPPTEGLGPNSYYNESSVSSTFYNSPQTPGWVHIDHCVDYTNTVGESNEYDNCSTMITLTITSQPDLLSENLGILGGGTSIKVGSSTKFTADVRDTGAAVGAFTDTFLYRINGAPFVPLNEIARTSLGAGASANDVSQGVTLTNTGTFTIRHCVDYYNTVPNEASETNNCTERSYSITQGPITVSCSVDPRNADIGENITWSASATGGTGPYSFQWSGGGLTGTTGTPITRSYSASGTYVPQVTAYDALGRSSAVLCPGLVVGDASVSASIYASLAGESDWTGGGLNIGVSDQVDLRWEGGGDATSCTGDSYYSTGGALSGTKSASQVSQAPATAGATRTYRVTCTGGGNSASDSVTITRASTTTPPTLTVSPTRVRQGETTTVTATLNGHTGCIVTGRGINPSGTDKNTKNLGDSNWSGETAPILGETTYRLTCSSGGNDTATAYILPADLQN